MAKKSDAVKIAELQFARDIFYRVVDVADNRLGHVLIGTAIVNYLNQVKRKDGNPLVSDVMRTGLNTAMVGYLALPVADSIARNIASWAVPAAAATGAAATVSQGGRIASATKSTIIKAARGIKSVNPSQLTNTVTVTPPLPSGEYISKAKQLKGRKSILYTLNPVNLFKD